MKKVLVTVFFIAFYLSISAKIGVDYGFDFSVKSYNHGEDSTFCHKICPTIFYAGVNLKITNNTNIGVKASLDTGDVYDFGNLYIQFDPDKVNYQINIHHEF